MKETEYLQRKERLKKTAEAYFEALKNKNFSAIPFSDDIVLRTPLNPGGANIPLTGKQSVYEQWWLPLEPALEGVTIKIIDHYCNDSMTGIVTKAEITLAGPGITLSTADLFIINEEGKVTSQENHFDASLLRG